MNEKQHQSCSSWSRFVSSQDGSAPCVCSCLCLFFCLCLCLCVLLTRVCVCLCVHVSTPPTRNEKLISITASTHGGTLLPLHTRLLTMAMTFTWRKQRLEMCGRCQICNINQNCHICQFCHTFNRFSALQWDHFILQDTLRHPPGCSLSKAESLQGKEALQKFQVGSPLTFITWTLLSLDKIYLLITFITR